MRAKFACLIVVIASVLLGTTYAEAVTETASKGYTSSARGLHALREFGGSVDAPRSDFSSAQPVSVAKTASRSCPAISLFSAAYGADRTQLRQLGLDLSKGIRRARSRTDAYLALEFSDFSTRAREQASAMHTLRVPNNYAATMASLVRALKAIASDLRSISRAAAAHNVGAAESATKTLLNDATKVKSADDALSRVRRLISRIDSRSTPRNRLISAHCSTPTTRASSRIDHDDQPRVRTRPDDPDPAPGGSLFNRRRWVTIQPAPTPGIAIEMTVVPLAHRWAPLTIASPRGTEPASGSKWRHGVCATGHP